MAIKERFYKIKMFFVDVRHAKNYRETIEEQDIQYDELLRKYGKLETLCNVLEERNFVLEDINTKHLETIGKLRKQNKELKKEIKDKEV